MPVLTCFNPRPHAGGDILIISFVSIFISFNPRPHAGGDNIRLAIDNDKEVSIHAPTRGATGAECEGEALGVFQSTPPRGGRRGGVAPVVVEGVSIHAPTRGATKQYLNLV